MDQHHHSGPGQKRRPQSRDAVTAQDATEPQQDFSVEWQMPLPQGERTALVDLREPGITVDSDLKSPGSARPASRAGT